MEFNKNWQFKIFEIKKSKFISYSFNIDNIDQFNTIYNLLKKEYVKATHICYAYKFVENQQLRIKYFDDNEPKGTAGLPILNVITQNNENNIAIFVIRYFGKSKLGAGTLLRSYSKAASFSLSAKNE